ncbi:radical SAM protein [Clostridium sp. E02]|uniref:radical SAM protein n=1 Tax=Clostridium sp. E02 TaxID=2487134 RepID=UPI000F54BA1C|nr:radical SAM protein [Clostridium sp. E02]
MIRKRKIKNAFTNEIQPDGSSINIIDPYTGCQIQCPYCFQMGNRNWSKDIFINTNIADLLKLQVKEQHGSDLYIGSMCDPYMDLEKQYRLTHKCLKTLRNCDSHVFITTKSDNQLILEDIELLKSFKVPVTVLFGLSNVNQAGKGKNHMNIKVANILKMEGLDVWVFITPVLPYVMNIEEMIEALDKKIPVYFDKLRVMTKGEQDKKVYHWINSCYPQYSSHYKKILFEKDETYYNNLFERYRNDSNIYFMTNIWEV